ncbi:MAG TPA: DUF11 domain-containing protein, partial [Solirubrobacterales bacterium]|nr:DUF11 domain-containing protein [Solirubrobacterales bacterium]
DATGTIENTAEVEGPNEDPTPADNEDTATTSVEEVSDLAIEKTASAPTVKPGETITYTLEVENKGPSASDPTTVTDTLPASLAYVSDDWGCDTSALPQITCDLGAMADDASATIEIAAEVDPDATGTIENTAKVEGPNSDPTPADNSSTAATTVTPLASDLELSKSAPATAVKAGEEITYTLVASNQGPDPSPETVVIDELPSELTYVSDDADCDTSTLPEIKCDLGTLGEGESETLHIVAKVGATDGAPIQNKARVSGANPDPELGDNPDAAQVPVAPVADPPPNPPAAPPAIAPPAPNPPKSNKAPKGTPRLTLTKTASSSRARPGAVVAYRITVANTGDAPARGVRVCDHPPAEQRTLRTEPAAESKTKPCWTLEKLAPGARRTFTLTAMVDPGSDRGAQRNRATATAANVKGVRADVAAVGVKPLPDTGCLARPLGGGLGGVEFLC